MRRSAFTMIELVFVMLVSSILFYIAIKNYNQYNLNKRIIDLKDNAVNMLNTQQNNFNRFNDYNTIKKQLLTDDTVKDNRGITYYLKKDYIVQTNPVVCDDTNLKGVYIYLKDTTINKQVTINTCDSPVKLKLQ